MSRIARVILGTVLLVVAGLAITATSASAHNVLKSSNPAQGEALARTPSSVVLTFDEPSVALGTKLVVTGPTGPVQVGAPQLVDTTVTQDLQPGAPAGKYTVDWRVTSADGHPISGSFSFTTEAAGVESSAPSLAPVPSTAPAPAPHPGGSYGSWLLVVAVLLVLTGVAVVGKRRRAARKDRSRT
jgi:methionine-rich copper-binding protein CopC